MQFRLLAFAALALSSAAPVLAADLVYEQPAPASEQQVYSAYDWSGFYLGAQGGYNWNQATILGSDVDLNSGSFGAHAGYNFQHGNIVYGIENDFNYNFEDGSDATVEWDASGRGRIGYAWDRTLFFATAGIAAAGAKVDVPGAGKKDDILIGWTAGGGVEHALTDNILVRGEYRYSDFGNKDFGSSIGDFGATQHKVLLGASYKF
ncbi:porin family protein [Agrobacterium tumefaciens]|uniref:outer membrane protein n=1 Tax=Agrobacterium tumefaciens TaxID=358 RepID=UPI0015740796|nr:outer membrane protein [Agrobacterium tumefaciens]UXT20449.1 porin family protein [Agrobacterium tumefaciens]WHO20758.1 porin family protein [Agrobacterium tumefaciens]WHO23543.1 porin family protein [Agrobacterium tumefaciens]